MKVVSGELPGKGTLEAIGNYRWRICALLFFATTVNYLDRQVLSLLKPLLEEQFGWTNAQYANIASVFQFTYAISMLFAGRFVDWLDTKKGGLKMLKTALKDEPFLEATIIEKIVPIEVAEPVTVFLSEEPAIMPNLDPTVTKLISTEHRRNKFRQVAVTNCILKIITGKIVIKVQRLVKTLE